MDEGAYPRGTMMEYFVWRGNLCIFQTQSALDIADFMKAHNHERNQLTYMKMLSSVNYMDDEEIDMLMTYASTDEGT